ncbi:6-phosphogluconolactonase [Crossiella equi]|uniref:6-phosphogluconolactonase n=1 Tax=Crossiella equi TaxID=130796 RepID=A0ABS5ANZ3_9PSEU|nr:6-phosphogluconolactonase [Crossiella equi]MBP2478305.1 6-phosphogluconolactonase [Crossiella equi]
MNAPQVVVHANQELLASAVAARLITALVDAQAARGVATLVLTGGRTGNAVLERVREAAARDAVDWSRVEMYWGDERFLPAGHADRNETQARAALLDHIPVDPARVHAVEPSDGRFGDDPDAAARAYAEVLGAEVPEFDVFLLGVGEEGHTASLFPDTPAVRERVLSVVAVRDCPKPPPTRVSLTLPAIRRARQVWLMTTGEAKADPVAQALAGASEIDIPAAGARGFEATLWLLDPTAAAKTR